jgi:hypothetical protein
VDDPTRAGDRRGGCVALPLILDRGDAAALPSNGGGWSTARHSFLSGVITMTSVFLSGQLSPEPSFFGLPFSIPILARKVALSKSLSSTVRAARAASDMSSGLSPRVASRIAFSTPRLMSVACAWPGVVPARIKRSQSLRPLNVPSMTVSTIASISQSPLCERVSNPSSPALPGSMWSETVAMVPAGMGSKSPRGAGALL